MFIKVLAVVSNINKPFKNINKTQTVKKIRKRKKRLQRKLSKKYMKLKKEKTFKKGEKLVKTKNIIKLEKRIKLIDRKLSNIRTNYIHQATSAIVKTKPLKVVMENLNIKGMMKNKHLA